MDRLTRKFLLILILIGSAYGIEHLNFIGGWPLGICKAVAIDPERELAFVGSGSTLLIYDISGLEGLSDTNDTNLILPGSLISKTLSREVELSSPTSI